MKTIACILSLFLFVGCGTLRNMQADPKNPAYLLSLLTSIQQAKEQSSADLRAMREAAPEAFAKSDRNDDGFLQPAELLRFLRDGKLEARLAFLDVLRNDSALLRAAGDAESIDIADRIDGVLADVEGWLLVLDLFEK